MSARSEARNVAHEFGLSGEALAEFRAEVEAYNLVAEAMANATPEQAARLRELAEGYIDAAVAVERKKQAQEDATEAAKAAKQAEADLQAELSSMVSGFSSAIQSADSFADALKRVGIQLAEQALKGALLGEGPMAAAGGLFKTIAGAVLGGVAGGIGNIWGTGPSASAIGSVGSGMGGLSGLHRYEGGGYTGDGARAGGLDGKGGFLAVLHPNETVLDHTRRQSAGGGNSVSVSLSFDARGAGPREVDALRAEMAEMERTLPEKIANAIRSPGSKPDMALSNRGQPRKALA